MSGVKINVGCGEFPAPGWLNLDLTHEAADRRHDVTEGLPEDITEPITRIYAGHVLEHLPKEDITPVLQLWREHPQVSGRTLLAIVGPDCNKADKLLARGELSEEEHRSIVHGAGRWAGDEHLWRSTGGETYELVRAAGWGVSFPYSLQYLALDQWPVTSQIGWQFGALCRALK